MTRRTRRLFNLPLVAATVCVAAVAGWTLIDFSQSHSALSRARQTGSDPVEVLSRARALTLQAEGDENLTLVARGTGQAFVADFKSVTNQLGGPSGHSGLLAQAAQLTAGQPGAAAQVTSAVTAYQNYLALHTQIRGADDGGNFTQAVGLAIGSGPSDQYPAFVKLDAALRQALDAEQGQFVTRAAGARSPLDLIRYGIPVLILVAAALAVVGIQQRVNDYR